MTTAPSLHREVAKPDQHPKNHSPAWAAPTHAGTTTHTDTHTQYGITVTSCFKDPPLPGPSLLGRAPQLPPPCRLQMGAQHQPGPAPQPWEAKQALCSLRGGGNWRERRGRSDPKSPPQGAPSPIPAARGLRAGAGRPWRRHRRPQCTRLQPHRHTHPPKKVSRSRETLSETGLEGVTASSSVPLCATRVAVGPLCLLVCTGIVLGRVTQHRALHQGMPAGLFCCFFFPQKNTQKKIIPIKSVEMLLCFGMWRNCHAPPGEVLSRAGGKRPGAAPGVAVVAERRGKMVCALRGRSWSPRPPRSQFSTGGIT